MDIKRAGEQRHAADADMASKHTKQRRQPRKGNTAVIILGAIVVAALLGFAGWMLFLKQAPNHIASAALNKDEYQAVFLSNGQVYFGKLQNTNGDFLSLKDIYYLQVDSSIQPSSGNDSSSVTTKSASDSSNVQLIKLGNELHGPEDQMQVSKEQVIFWENLKQDGKVSKAIESYTKK